MKFRRDHGPEFVEVSRNAWVHFALITEFSGTGPQTVTIKTLSNDVLLEIFFLYVDKAKMTEEWHTLVHVCLVFQSPVWSGFWTQFGVNRDRDQSRLMPKRSETGPDPKRPVFSGPAPVYGQVLTGKDQSFDKSTTLTRP